VFTDVKTAWVIAGIGHGHDDVVTADAEGNITANAAITEVQRITPENIDSFHFHGAVSDYPLSAVLVVPYDTAPPRSCAGAIWTRKTRFR
jgi:putative ABC transport system permease protein